MFARLTGAYFLTLETGHCRKIEVGELRSHFLTLQKNLVLTWCCFTFTCESLNDECCISDCDWGCQTSISCGSLSSHLGPFHPAATGAHPNPSLLPSEVEVREKKYFQHERKDPACIFTYQATAHDNAFPTQPFLKPASELSSQANTSKPTWAIFPITEPSQQSETSSKRKNHLVSKIRPPAFIPPSPHLPRCLPGTHGSVSRLPSTSLLHSSSAHTKLSAQTVKTKNKKQ